MNKKERIEQEINKTLDVFDIISNDTSTGVDPNTLSQLWIHHSTIQSLGFGSVKLWTRCGLWELDVVVLQIQRTSNPIAAPMVLGW